LNGAFQQRFYSVFDRCLCQHAQGCRKRKLEPQNTQNTQMEPEWLGASAPMNTYCPLARAVVSGTLPFLRVLRVLRFQFLLPAQGRPAPATSMRTCRVSHARQQQMRHQNCLYSPSGNRFFPT
jgi:hypothetical protein